VSILEADKHVKFYQVINFTIGQLWSVVNGGLS